MTQERIKEIMDQRGSMYSSGAIRKGLNILAKYNPNADITGAEHDIVYGGALDDLVISGITETDLIELVQLGWFLDNDNWLAHFA